MNENLFLKTNDQHVCMTTDSFDRLTQIKRLEGNYKTRQDVDIYRKNVDILLLSLPDRTDIQSQLLLYTGRCLYIGGAPVNLKI